MHVTEERQRLDPEIGVLLISVLLFIGLALGTRRDTWILAPLEDLLSLIVMDVESKQLLSKVQTLAAIFDSLIVLVDLKQEEHIILVDFTVSVILAEEVSNAGLDLVLLVSEL